MTARAPRADAVRNRRRIVDAAREVFAEQGIADASLNDVARRAGVGPGTLWRHFSGRDALLVELVGHSLDDLAASAATKARAADPSAGLATWCREMTAHVVAHRGLAERLACGDPDGPLAERCAAAEAGAATLVAAARAQGAVPADLTASDLIALCTAVAWAAGSPSPAEHLLDLVLRGVAPGR